MAISRRTNTVCAPCAPGCPHDIGPSAAGVNGLGGRVAGLEAEAREERRKSTSLCPDDGCMTRTGGGRCQFHLGREAAS